MENQDDKMLEVFEKLAERVARKEITGKEAGKMFNEWVKREEVQNELLAILKAEVGRNLALGLIKEGIDEQELEEFRSDMNSLPLAKLQKLLKDEKKEPKGVVLGMIRLLRK